MKMYRITHGVERPWTKTFRIMKLTTFLLFTSFVAMSASSYSQNTKLNLSAQNSSLIDIFRQIEDQSEFYFYFQKEEVKSKESVSVDLKDALITDILDQVLAKTGLEYKIIDRYVVVKPIGSADPKIAMQQDRRITGKVTDSTGGSLPGVSIVVKGTTMGVITDNSGNYALSNITENATLQFSFVGMKNQEIIVGNKTTINVTLSEDAIGIEEVVAVGYGTQKKGNLTGSIASVKTEELTLAPTSSTVNALAGRLPGLISQQSSGKPGSDQAAISIRGFGQALWIVDGVETDFNNIDANQIESVSILKDGSASIYGSRAGNGVILVTTKRGIDQKPIVTLNSSYTMQGITAIGKPSSAGQYAEMENERLIHQGKPALFTEEQIKKYYNGTDPQYPNTNWYKETIRDWAPQQQHNLSLRGGSDKIKYYGFFGYLDQETIWKKNGGGYGRYNLQSNIDAKVTDNLSIQIDLAAVVDDQKLSWRQAGDALWEDYWDTLPIFPATLPDPTKNSYAAPNGTGSIGLISDYKIAGYTQTKNQNLKGTSVINYRIKQVQGLYAKAFINYVQNTRDATTFTKPFSYYTYDVASKQYSLVGSLGNQAQLRVGKYTDRSITGQFSLNYDNTFGNHHITALALYETISYRHDELYAGRDKFLTPEIDQMFVGNTTTNIADGRASEMGRVSYVGRLNYSYKDKYLVETTFRADASAKFPTDSRWGYFPSISLAWRLNQENFMKNITSIDELKLRASYGSSGYDNVANFAYLSGYQLNGQWLTGSGTQQGIGSTGLANPYLTWEKINIYNLGTNFSFWKRKLFGEADVFYRDLLGIPATRILSLPSTFGANLPPENINSQNTHGFELTLGTSGKSQDFSYEVSGNLSWSRSKWDHFDEPNYTDPDQLRINELSGKWTDAQFGYKSDGLFTSQEEITNLKYTYDGNPTLKPGDIKYVDVNKDGKLDWKDQINIGKGTMPHWMVGGAINLKYKNFDLSSLIQGAFGYYTNVTLDHGEFVLPAVVYKLRWTDATNDPNALIPRLGGSATNSYSSDYWLKKSGYLRLKVLSVGYNIPKNLLTKINIQELRVYFAGTNLVTFNKIKEYGIDPEAPSGNGTRYYPQQKTITLGLNLSF
jgi:TonB-linked SusC/RagA family outer membrane protein